MELNKRKPIVPLAVLGLLLVILLQLVLMARENSATFDEPCHIYSG